MPDYRVYGADKNGKIVEQSTEELAKFLGVTEFDAQLLVTSMNMVKTICMIAGGMESPQLIWNQNIPDSLIEFVTDHVAGKLKANPAWQTKDFDWSLLYEEDGQTLKFK